MANRQLTASIIAKRSLAILENELDVLKTIHRGYEDEFDSKVNGYKIGDTLSIKRPPDFTVRTGANTSVQDVIEGKTSIQIATQKGIDFSFTSTELTLNIDELSDRVIKPAMSALINNITADIFSDFYKNVPWLGTAGEIVNSFADFAVGTKALDRSAVPTDDRWAALQTDDWWDLAGAQTSLYNNSINNSYRDGEIGNIGGVKTKMSQALPTHTVGPLGGTPLVNGASQNVSYDTAKDTWTQTLITDGWTASAAARVKEGDSFTMTGVNQVNPKTKQDTGKLQQFVIRADGSSDGSGNLTITISPPIITSGPYQTVTAAPADNIGLTMKGTAATAYAQNLIYHKNAYAAVFVPMDMPAAAYGGARETYKGMSVRVIPGYNISTDVSTWRLDVLYGKKCIDPRLAYRLSGSP